MSHPVRGAWGVRGLKYFITSLFTYFPQSHPVRGAWIEISYVIYDGDKILGRIP